MENLKYDTITDPALGKAPVTRTNTCTTREAAERLAVSLKTVQLWVENGTLAAWKTAGGHRRILRSSVENLLDQRQEESGQRDAAFRIVIVEDDPVMRRLYEEKLARTDKRVSLRFADNGFTGLLRVGEMRPDLLIADLLMPHIDGFSMLRILRENPPYHDMRIAVVTVLSPDEIEQRGDLPDNISVFHKPLQFNALLELIRDC